MDLLLTQDSDSNKSAMSKLGRNFGPLHIQGISDSLLNQPKKAG